MSVNMVYFARIREAIGTSGEEISPPPEVQNIGDLLTWLAGQDEKYADAFRARDRIRTAINQVYVTMESGFKDGDEIAIFPPVTGG